VVRKESRPSPEKKLVFHSKAEEGGFDSRGKRPPEGSGGSPQYMEGGINGGDTIETSVLFEGEERGDDLLAMSAFVEKFPPDVEKGVLRTFGGEIRGLLRSPTVVVVSRDDLGAPYVFAPPSERMALMWGPILPVRTAGFKRKEVCLKEREKDLRGPLQGFPRLNFRASFRVKP